MPAWLKRWQAALLWLGFLLLALAAYANVLNAYFLSDDFVQLGRIKTGNLSPVYAATQGGLLRPLFTLSLLVDLKLWGLNPLGYHVVNIALHALNAVGVFYLARALAQRAELSGPTRPRLACAASLIFLLHPAHTEAVTWISARADLLATLFCLLTLLLLLAYTQTRSPWQISCALLTFALALLSKESAICLPLVLWLVLLCVASRESKRAAFKWSVKVCAPFLLVLFGYIVVRALLLGTLIGGYGAERHLNFKQSVVVSQLLRFALRALIPVVALRSATFLESHTLSILLLALGGALLLLCGFLLSRRQTRHALASWTRRHAFLWLLLGAFVCCLLPVINLRINVFDTQGERYLYLPSVFSSIALAYIAARLVRRTEGWWLALCLLLLCYAVSLWLTNRTWVRAGQLAHSIVNDLARPGGHDTLLLLNAPDTLDGVYLYRNGLDEAARLFQPPRALKSVQVLAYHALGTPLDEVTLTTAADVYTLRLENEATSFERIEANNCAELLERSSRSLRFRLNGCPDTVNIFYFSGGQILPVVR
jgi:protein O-mannosyl-transferase